MVNCLTWMLVDGRNKGGQIRFAELIIAYFVFAPPRPRLAQAAGAPVKLFLDFILGAEKNTM